MDPRCSPAGILPRHPADQVTCFLRHLRSAGFAALPLPIEAEPFPVPADHGRGLDDGQGIPPLGEDAGQENPESPVGPGEPRPPRSPLKNLKLMPERQVL